jgi:2-succinyl-5-enolpyruvyl-6-hydroxy-3-cyclohexene-1-carboxylate synthase
LQGAVERSIRSGGTTIVEIRTEREQNLALHRRIADAVSAALGNA